MLFTICSLLLSTLVSAVRAVPNRPSSSSSGLLNANAIGVDIDPGFQLPSAMKAVQKDCSQWGRRALGKYTLYNNFWEDSLARGVQCSAIVSANPVSWYTTFDWTPNIANVIYVLTYTNLQLELPSPPLSTIAALPVKFSSRYSGRGVVANVAFDIYVSRPGQESIEIMVQYGAYGGSIPLTNTGAPIAVVSLAGKTWNLFFGRNEGARMNVYSFMATDSAQAFRINCEADLLVFLHDLVNRGSFSMDYTVTTIALGSEVWKGHQALLLVEDYSLEPIYK